MSGNQFVEAFTNPIAMRPALGVVVPWTSSCLSVREDPSATDKRGLDFLSRDGNNQGSLYGDLSYFRSNRAVEGGPALRPGVVERERAGGMEVMDLIFRAKCRPILDFLHAPPESFMALLMSGKNGSGAQGTGVHA